VTPPENQTGDQPEDPPAGGARWQKGDGLPPPKNAAEAVGRVLAHVERQAGRRTSDAAFDGLLAVPDLPLTALADLGPLSRLDDVAQADALPSLLLETESGPVQIEICPFGPLALLSSDGQADTDPVSAVLYASGLFPLFPADLDGMGEWHARPLPRWLFPARLSQALALFETLRSS